MNQAKNLNLSYTRDLCAKIWMNANNNVYVDNDDEKKNENNKNIKFLLLLGAWFKKKRKNWDKIDKRKQILVQKIYATFSNLEEMYIFPRIKEMKWKQQLSLAFLFGYDSVSHIRNKMIVEKIYKIKCNRDKEET